MKQKPIFRRRLANDDIESAISYYLDEAGAEVAFDFVTQFEEVLKKISKHPAAGSQRYGHELDIPGVRHWPMKRFPYLLFYLEKADRIEVVRVLHSKMDIPSWLGGNEEF